MSMPEKMLTWELAVVSGVERRFSGMMTALPQ
jgi:hypothetical protein